MMVCLFEIAFYVFFTQSASLLTDILDRPVVHLFASRGVTSAEDASSAASCTLVA
jgi:hypothetical protein